MSTFSIFIALIILVCFLLVLVVMVQNPKGGGLSSSFGAGTQQVGGVQKTSDFLNIKITHIEKLNSSYSSINPTLQKLINSDHLDIFRKLIPIDKRDKLKNFFYKKNKPILLKDFLSNSEIMEMKKYFSQEYEFLKKHQVHL